MFNYNGTEFKKLKEAELAVMVDFPEALDDDLADLFDMYIEED